MPLAAASATEEEKPWGEVSLIPWQGDDAGKDGNLITPPMQNQKEEENRTWYNFPFDDFFAKYWKILIAPEDGTDFEQEMTQKGARLIRQGRYREALDILGIAIKTYPDNPATLNNLGIVLRRLGKDDQALEAYHFSVRVSPNFALGYKNMAILYDENGNQEAAAKAYRSYCRLKPEGHDAEQVRTRADFLEALMREEKKQ